MKILLGSKNPSKLKSLELALNEIGITQFEIICLEAKSGVNSEPIGQDIIKGADNRNQSIKDYAIKSKINYDYLCSIEGGFSIDEYGLPFIVSYAIFEDKNGKKSTGKSLGIRLTLEMFDYVKNGNSLNKVIESIVGKENNKKSQGVTGYITNGLYSRDKFDKEAVISALIPIIFKTNRDTLSNKIK